MAWKWKTCNLLGSLYTSSPQNEGYEVTLCMYLFRINYNINILTQITTSKFELNLRTNNLKSLNQKYKHIHTGPKGNFTKGILPGNFLDGTIFSQRRDSYQLKFPVESTLVQYAQQIPGQLHVRICFLYKNRDQLSETQQVSTTITEPNQNFKDPELTTQITSKPNIQ